MRRALAAQAAARAGPAGLALRKVGEVGGSQALHRHSGQCAPGEAAAYALAEHDGGVLVGQVRALGDPLADLLRAKLLYLVK